MVEDPQQTTAEIGKFFEPLFLTPPQVAAGPDDEGI
jgi:hypothetical protein